MAFHVLVQRTLFILFLLMVSCLCFFSGSRSISEVYEWTLLCYSLSTARNKMSIVKLLLRSAASPTENERRGTFQSLKAFENKCITHPLLFRQSFRISFGWPCILLSVSQGMRSRRTLSAVNHPAPPPQFNRNPTKWIKTCTFNFLSSTLSHFVPLLCLHLNVWFGQLIVFVNAVEIISQQ